MENSIFANVLNQLQIDPLIKEIILVTGEFIIEGSESTYVLNGKILFSWEVFGRTKITGKIESFQSKKEFNSPLFANDQHLKIFYCKKDIGQVFRSFVSENTDGASSAEFIFSTGAVLKDEKIEKFNCVKFLLPNLHFEQSFREKELSYKKLKVKFHPVGDSFKTYRHTVLNRGIGVSFWVEVYRESKKAITLKEFDEFEACLSYFLKMTFGKRISPILYTYFFNEEEVKLETKLRFLEANKNIQNWANSSEVNIEYSWGLFSKMWNENQYSFRHFIPTLSEWYIEALSGRFDSKTIVAGQICLELLFATVHYEILKLPENQRDIQNASLKFKLLLNSIGLRYPYFNEESFPNLKKSISLLHNNTNDPVDVLTSIRNSIIHFKPSDNQKIINVSTISDVACLTLWYIEITYLAIIGYSKSYKSRNYPNFISKSEEFNFKI